MSDEKEGIYRMSELVEMAGADEGAFWTCPATGRDCRREPAPVLAVVSEHASGACASRFQMYASAEAAGDVTPHLIHFAPGETTAHYLLDCWLHIGGKAWVDPVGMATAMRRVAWTFGDRSWSFGRSSGPRFPGRGACA
ncbi:MAG TPA: hypothetical protein VGN75_15105 [Kaistia sp.]|jgi:hypothetical protein|nr:hypothetical protein [Kaistia sp.]